MFLLVQRMKVLAIYYQTKLFLKLVMGNLYKVASQYFSLFSTCLNSRHSTYLFIYLLVIAKQMPVTTSKLKRLVKSKHPYIERNLASVVSIIGHSMQNAAFFEPAVEHLKLGHAGMVRPYV